MALDDVGEYSRSLLAGLDSLYVSFFVDTATSQIDWDELAYEKLNVKSKRQEFSEIALGSERFVLKPYGRAPYTYVLENKAFEIRALGTDATLLPRTVFE